MIYHAYKNCAFDNQLTYWYTTDEDEDDSYLFDIRELPSYRHMDRVNHKAILRAAAKRGEIKFPTGGTCT